MDKKNRNNGCLVWIVCFVIFFISLPFVGWWAIIIAGVAARIFSSNSSEEDKTQTTLTTNNTDASGTDTVIDINTATREELLVLPGIGTAETDFILKHALSGRIFVVRRTNSAGAPSTDMFIDISTAARGELLVLGVSTARISFILECALSGRTFVLRIMSSVGVPSTYTLVDINTATHEKLLDWDIGAAAADWILKRRSGLVFTVPTTDNTDASGIDTLIDINTAIREELLALPGIGAAEAGLILKRTQSGQTFSSLDELAEYLALKPHKIAHLRGKIRFSLVEEGEYAAIPRHGRVIDMGYEEDSSAPRYGRVIDFGDNIPHERKDPKTAVDSSENQDSNIVARIPATPPVFASVIRTSKAADGSPSSSRTARHFTRGRNFLFINTGGQSSDSISNPVSESDIHQDELEILKSAERGETGSEVENQELRDLKPIEDDTNTDDSDLNDFFDF